jgi:hypothetical protein
VGFYCSYLHHEMMGAAMTLDVGKEARELRSCKAGLGLVHPRCVPTITLCQHLWEMEPARKSMCDMSLA